MSTNFRKPSVTKTSKARRAFRNACIVIRNGGRLYKCLHCSYSATRRDYLKSHERIHSSSKKPYKFRRQSYVPTQKNESNEQNKVHAEDNPYKCQHCSYMATNKCILIIHERIHTGERPYKCPHCTYASSQKGNLGTHLKIHHGENPYKCQQCNYSATKKSDLKEHKKTHGGEKPYKCQYCSYSAAVSNNLKKHEGTCTLRNHEKSLIGPKVLQQKLSTKNIKIRIGTHINGLSGKSILNALHEFQPGDKPFKCQQDHTGFSGNKCLDDHKDLQQESEKKCAKIVERVKSSNIASIEAEHPVKELAVIEENDSPQDFDMVFSKDQEIGDSDSSTDFSKTFPCLDCDYVCFSEEELCMHYSFCHNLPVVRLKAITFN